MNAIRAARLADLEQVEAARTRQDPVADPRRRHLALRQRLLGKPAAGAAEEHVFVRGPGGRLALERPRSREQVGIDRPVEVRADDDHGDGGDDEERGGDKQRVQSREADGERVQVGAHRAGIDNCLDLAASDAEIIGDFGATALVGNRVLAAEQHQKRRACRAAVLEAEGRGEVNSGASQ